MQSLKSRLLLLQQETGVDHQIVEYILTYNQKYEDITILQIANAAYVSKASVTRFSKKLGLNGFKELKYELIHGLSNVDKDDNFFEKINARLEKFYQLEDKHTIDQVVDLFIKYQKINFYAVAENNLIIQDFAIKLRRLNKQVNCDISQDFQYINAMNTDEETLSVIISYTLDAKFYQKILNKINNNPKIIISNEYNERLDVENTFIKIPDSDGPNEVMRSDSRFYLFLIVEMILDTMINKNHEYNHLLNKTINK